MERNIYEQNRLREVSLRIANQLLLAEKEPTGFGLEIHWGDTRFFENEWGMELFRQPLLSVYFSDEDFPNDHKHTGTILDEYAVTECGRGYDDHLTLFAGSSPITFGVRKGTGDFGDHETEHGILVYKSDADITDENVRKIIDNSFSEGVNAIKPDEERPLRLFVANIESGNIVYNKPCMLDTEDKSIEVFLSMPLFGSELVNIALSGKYFVFLGRPERLGAYMEQKERFDISEVQDLISR